MTLRVSTTVFMPAATTETSEFCQDVDGRPLVPAFNSTIASPNRALSGSHRPSWFVGHAVERAADMQTLKRWPPSPPKMSGLRHSQILENRRELGSLNQLHWIVLGLPVIPGWELETYVYQ